MQKYILLLLLLLEGILSLHGENSYSFFNKYNFSFITEDTGLPHNFVKHIYKDSQGYIWVATNNGIGRYNGYQFIHYNTQTEPIKLKSNYIHEICEDPFRRLWIASEEGIDVIDLDKYCQIQLQTEQVPGIRPLLNSYIESIYKDKKGNLWISTDKSLWCIEFATDGQIKDYHKLENNAESPIHAVIDLDWCICAGIDNNVYSIDKCDNHILKASLISDLIKPFTEDWRILCMETHGDLLWIGSNRGLFKYNHANKEMKRYRYSNHKPGMLSQAYVTDIKLTTKGDVIISTLNGLNVYDKATDSFTYIRQNNDKPDKSLNCNFINCLLTDDESIWVGTEIGGINLLTPNCLQTYIWQYSYLRETSLSPNPVNAITEDKEGNLWVGTVEGGLNKKSSGSNEFIHYTFDQTNDNSISNNSISGILIDSENYLWAYTWGVGINELNLNIANNETFIRHRREDELGLEGDFVSSACEDLVNNGLWFGTTRGLHFYNKANQHFTRVLFDKSDNEFDAVRAMIIDRKNRLWLGTSEGVFIMDLHSFSPTSLNFDYAYLKYKLTEPNSLELEKINCILEDKEGIIWLGANGNGLYQLVEENNNQFRFKNYTHKDGLSNNTVIGIVEDKEGQLWMSTNYGISQLDKTTMTFTNYTKEDGLPTNQFYWNAYYYSLQNDLLYFGTINGLVAFHPNVVKKKEEKTQVKLTSLTNDTKCISLHEKDHGFSIEFSTLNYGNCNRVKYAYRLKNYESTWIETMPGEHTAKYNSIPAGNYSFQVRATDEKGHWSDQITEIVVYIKPYFYKTWWFYLLLAILIAAAISYFYSWRLKKYRERHLAETTEEKIIFFTNITHEFRTPITLINGPIKHALNESTEPAVKHQLQIAERNSNYLLSLVNELMDFRKLDNNKVVLNKENHNLIRFIQNILMPFEVFANERNITIASFFRLSTPYWVYDAGYMHKALVNLISNAIKFTPDHGKISIYVSSTNHKDSEQLFIDIQDTGSGIATEDLERIFDRFYQSKKSVKYPVYGQSSTGIGLFLCRKIITLHGGEIVAGNNHRQGATFRILLPLEKGVAQTEPDREESNEREDLVLPTIDNNGKNETILIVEDNADMRTYIRSILQHDYVLFESPNGAEALECIRKNHIDLIISDLMMPVMDGNELSRRVKANLATSHIPFIMLTAVRSARQEKMSYEIGVDEYLCKPFDEEILKLRIRNTFNLRRKYKSMFSVSMNSEALNIDANSKDNAFMMDAINLMKENYTDSDYNLERFVRDMRYSKTLVNQKLQLLTGQSIGQFMKNYRLNVAKETLMKSGNNISVSEIAYAVGFNDPKYFTKCFKELFGALPSEYLDKN
ncbi:two-component regulator propeller domain-containing protein [Bacteroides sp. 519]|uniref:hybrid sensor histidine kinase/response regulator transcription factor n=1 Tax=Bacteroides sp. 519 TaxID=2302937 RepID=UPI0013D10381|nr:two-component regulator propeller domain-containing protein [Bacteroides sp. 519]NDV57728.1 response regulator [Bacteroides sp. 519]